MKTNNVNKYAAIKDLIAAAKKESHNGLPFKVYYPNTELCVDVKFFTHTMGRMLKGMIIPGYIMCDREGHFIVIEVNNPESANAVKRNKNRIRRNPHVLELERINVNKKKNGTLYPTFKRPRYTEDFTFQDFCREAAEELLMVASAFDKLGFVEEGNGK